LFEKCQTKIETENIEKIISKLLLKSDSLYQNKEYKEAIIYFDSIITLDSTKGIVFFRRGVCYAKIYKYQKAIDDHLKCIELNYRVESSSFNVGLSYEILLNYPMALFYYKKAYGLNINNKKAKERIDFIENLYNCINND